MYTNKLEEDKEIETKVVLSLLSYYHDEGLKSQFESILGYVNSVNINQQMSFYINYYVLLYKIQEQENAYEVS